MCRQVTLDIDMARFSEAYRTMSGDEAKQVLVMLVCGGHATSSHSSGLRNVGINPAAPTAVVNPAEVNERIAAAAEDFLEKLGEVRPSDVLDGLADKPKPGAKKRARQSFTALLGVIYGFRKDVVWSKPLNLVGSSEHVSPSP